MFSDLPIQQLLDQLTTIFILLERPIVQRQIAAVAVVVGLSWLLARGLRRLIRRSVGRSLERAASSTAGDAADEPQTAAAHSRWQRALNAFQQLYFPLISLALLQIAALLFDDWNLPAGLVRAAGPYFWYLLAYEIIVALLYARFDAAVARPYQRRILLPLFVGILGVNLLDNVVSLQLLAAIELLRFSDEFAITLGRVVIAGVILYLFVTAAALIRQAIERAMGDRSGDMATRTTILIVSRYAVLGLGVIIAAAALGFDTSSLALIGGGLSIGIGFGLQQIVANFISGILLLFEQSLRPGDVIDINGKIGTVKRLSIRSTSIVTNDNVEIIVPNERFLTTEVTTYTRDDYLVRVAIPLGVSYKSDPKEVREILKRTVSKHGLVRETPAPRVFFMGFGASSLDFEVRVWMDQPRRAVPFRSDLYYMIWEALKKNGIEIPFPQRDLNLGTGWERLYPERPAGARSQSVVEAEEDRASPNSEETPMSGQAPMNEN